MFGTQIASELGISRVVIPLGPGNFCAVGMLQCEVIHQYLKPVRITTSDTTIESLRSIFSELKESGKDQLTKEGFRLENIRFEERLAMRYPGQHFTLELPLEASIENLEKAFYRVHKDVYRFAFSEPVIITDLIVNAYGSKPKSILENPTTRAKGGSVEALSETRPVRFEGRFIETQVYKRDKVPVDSSFRGPVIFEELGSTTIVRPGWTARVDDIGNLILERKE